jgi:DNA-binding NarL/FixJ family response regulator
VSGIRVVLADDQELVRSGFAMILAAQPDIEVAAEAGDGRAAVAAVHAHRPDVVLMDIQMPGLDGLAATRLICAHSSAKVVIVTTFDLDDYVYQALRAGASGFLLKDVRRDDLVHAVRVVAAGEALLAPTVTRRLIAHVLSSPVAPAVPQQPGMGLWRELGYGPGPAPGPAGTLTGRERQILGLLGRGLSNAEIAAMLVLSEYTVKTHVSNVLAKLGLRDRIHAVIYAYENAIAVPGEPRRHS